MNEDNLALSLSAVIQLSALWPTSNSLQSLLWMPDLLQSSHQIRRQPHPAAPVLTTSVFALGEVPIIWKHLRPAAMAGSPLWSPSCWGLSISPLLTITSISHYVCILLFLFQSVLLEILFLFFGVCKALNCMLKWDPPTYFYLLYEIMPAQAVNICMKIPLDPLFTLFSDTDEN